MIPSRRREDRRRLAWATVFAVTFHAAAIFAATNLDGPVRRAPAPPVELVFFEAPPAAPPPPPPAGSPTASGSVPRVARAKRPSVRRPVPAQPRPEPKPEPAPAPTPEVEPNPEHVGSPEPVDETPTEATSGVAGVAGGEADGVAGGVLGGASGGAIGGMVGSPGGQALELSQVERAPQVLESVRPRYPASARRRRIEGRVVVRVIVGADGVVEKENTRVLASAPGLDEAAIDAVIRWRFSPALGAGGRPVRVIIDIPIQFSLR